ncbi:hypothetical protein CBM2626_U10045 [Cupriavidus taiwanensis]|uniref:Mutator family transposase n=1 Tax=Cupriavidus taiwanensis TaxID=164546 RepID=A0A375HDF2_9BURK|nr:hypothetical protein CBM2614_U70006 [Cupriavidus taiwanensis]SOZ73966.1 hypothetical protein CBM2615_U50001 [Cupriavidus taiwanensis]SOZ75434.1 hypothetical protein CBM2613_U50001 [Cupriavidus taiwanensis]SPA03784.1 hypothetical protein CBM2626_U10045 [Cupriavidus taiwanensis]SPA12610.1 hypothetical protein CBM2625_U10053 [Cupriavidus taiwanensis]
MEQALAAVFPNTTLQTCIVHLIRNSLEYANWKERRAVAAALKPVYTALTVEAALAELAAFENGEWGRWYAPIGASWRRAWDQVIPFFTFPSAIRKIIYCHCVEALPPFPPTLGYARPGSGSLCHDLPQHRMFAANASLSSRA